MADKDYFAIALEKGKRQIRTVTSDPGHCLWSALIDADKVGCRGADVAVSL